MGSLFGGGAPAQQQQPQMIMEPAKVEPPIVMPIKDETVDRQNAMKAQARARAGKTTRANTIIGADDTLGDAP